ncbi:MAG: RICIN domain-containing protein [Lewinellaceae bacterium]|nr:RICIN domain-containing protein [Lewinellaceae bacterium]
MRQRQNNPVFLQSGVAITSTPAPANYFRVSAVGFTCNRETSDDAFERDGKHDEIYLSAISYMINTDGQIIPRTRITTKSRVMGDVNNRSKEERRVMAGSAVGGLGGIQTGDAVPQAEPWKNSQASLADLLPFILWEGQLQPGGDNVIIHPSVFEWDGPGDFLTNFWENSIIGRLTNLPVSATVGLVDALLDGPFPNSYNFDAPGINPAPTLAQQFPRNFYKVSTQVAQRDYKVVTSKPADRPVGSERSTKEGFIHRPLQIRLWQETAVQLMNTDIGYGRGVLPIRFLDDGELKGDYTLYLKIEQLSMSAETNQINVTSSENFEPTTGYILSNVLAGHKVIDILNGEKVDGTFTVIYQPKGYDSQKWRLRKVNEDYYNISSVYSNKNLDVGSSGNGANVVTNSPGNAETQQWRLIRYCDGSFFVKKPRLVEGHGGL